MRNLLFAALIPFSAFATDPYPRNKNIDVKHYHFQLEVNDSTDRIAGEAVVTIQFKNPVSEFELDLVSQNSKGQGMQVSEMLLKGKPLNFSHQKDRLKILLNNPPGKDEHLKFTIRYSGIPQDGLIIGKNKFGDRGFFGDNWPDRGHHWLPCIDHPYDKATVDFSVIAPLHYSVVANGIKTEESPVDYKRKLTRWHEEVPIPVKVMVTGIARFAIQYVGEVNDIPVQSWIYPQNKDYGFYDYSVAAKPLEFFQRYIGPYPYKKLANVQSKTRWGGLENANTIFYYENSVTGRNESEALIAHEEAHQWFGNSASENDWHHVWLSEGFATYFANLYLEHTYGRDRLIKEQQTDRLQVIDYFKEKPGPVIDTTIIDINKVLSTNTYQKAGWVLHMLRHELGDSVFQKGVRKYYAVFRDSNAMTLDFQKIMEETSGKDLNAFFNQWLYREGHPRISGSWRYDAKRKALLLELEQTQKGAPFRFSLEVGITGPDGLMVIHVLPIDKKSLKLAFPTEKAPLDVALDPGTWLLYEGEIVKK